MSDSYHLIDIPREIPAPDVTNLKECLLVLDWLRVMVGRRCGICQEALTIIAVKSPHGRYPSLALVADENEWSDETLDRVERTLEMTYIESKASDFVSHLMSADLDRSLIEGVERDLLAMIDASR